MVERRSERPEIALHVGAAGIPRLFGTDVVRRPERATALRQQRIVVRDGEAEIDEARSSSALDQDVSGLDVAVHDAALEGVLERLDERDEQAQRLALGEWPLAQSLLERDAVDELHGVPPHSTDFAHVDRGDDVWMSEAGRPPRLPVEPLLRTARPHELPVGKCSGSAFLPALTTSRS